MDSNDIYTDIALEKEAKERFGVSLEIGQVIARRIAVGHSAHATIYLSKKKQLYCYIEGPASLLLSDVKKMIARIGLVAEAYVPPKGQPGYFDDIGREKFRAVFPGRNSIVASDIIYYRTLAPYCPALVMIKEVKNGTIYCADNDSAHGWRQCAKFSYRRIKTS